MSDSVTLVGSGVASLLLGVELRRARPDLSVRIVTADDDARAGGHLASWDERGFPVEHGFHALFQCYRTANSLLDAHGLLSQFVPGAEHSFFYRGDRGERVRNGWHNLFPPVSWRDRLASAKSTMPMLRLLRAVRDGDSATIAALDAEDFRDALLRLGVGSYFIESPLVRSFYGFGFVGDRSLSAAIAFSLMVQLLGGARMLHFPRPSRETLIDPLRRRFVALGGEWIDRTKLLALTLEEHGQRVRSARWQRADGSVTDEPVDRIVLGLDLGSFQKLQWLGAQAPRFARDAARLEGAASLSLQAWFDHDPVPPHIDAVLGGLPEPWSTVCPITRVRRVARDPHGFELIACGPESGFEDTPDEVLRARFFHTLSRLGFRLRPDGRDAHVVLRRNRSASERYLLTRPGELTLRPSPRTSLENLSMVGAWTRVPFAIPSVEAAAQSVVAVRDALLARSGSAAVRSSRSTQHPSPPYRQEGISRIVRVPVDSDALAKRCPAGLTLAAGFRANLLMFITEYEAHAVRDPSGPRFAAREVMLAAVVHATNEPRTRLGLHPLVLYLDSDVTMTAGREAYGFDKRLARVEADAHQCEVVRAGIAPSQGGLARPMSLLSAQWSRSNTPMPKSAFSQLIRRLDGVSLFNQSRSTVTPGIDAPLVRDALLCVNAYDVELGVPTLLRDVRVQVTPSQLDPLHELLPPRSEVAFGVELPMSFTLGAAREIAVGP